MDNQIKNVNLREIVLDILTEINDKKEFSHILINNALAKYQYLDKNQRAFISKLSLGTIERRIELDYIINQFSKTPVKKMKPLIRNIVEMAVYQIMYMESVPDSAACNEAVKLSVKRGFTGLKGFVNGVLRNIARNKECIEYPDVNEDWEEYVSVKYSMPQWIVNMWEKQFGKDSVENILKGMTGDRKTYIRCNTSKMAAGDIKQVLIKEGVTVKEVDGIGYAYEISDYDYLAALKSFNDGLYFVQDISSMMAGELAAPKADDFVIDVCGAPGGKSANASLKIMENAEAMGKETFSGRVISRDVSEYKVNLIRENINRLGITNVEPQVADALVKDESLTGKADILIADLPCSGLGVMGRKPDIRYNVIPEQLEDIVKLQRDILKVVCSYVKTKGVLVYSTCTINKDENDNNADWICRELGFEKDGEYVTILPDSQKGTDGFFVARLIKK